MATTHFQKKDYQMALEIYKNVLMLQEANKDEDKKYLFIG